jgi:hypothetical protein
VAAAIVLIPVTYLLLLSLRLLLFATELVHYTGIDQLLIAGTSGVLLGCGVVALLTAKGTLKGTPRSTRRRLTSGPLRT